MKTFIIVAALLWVSPDRSGEVSAFELTHLRGKPLYFKQFRDCDAHIYINHKQIFASVNSIYSGRAVPFHIFCKGVVRL